MILYNHNQVSQVYRKEVLKMTKKEKNELKKIYEQEVFQTMLYGELVCRGHKKYEAEWDLASISKRTLEVFMVNSNINPYEVVTKEERETLEKEAIERASKE